MSTLEGQTLGNYRIETLLGTGGMGEVYRAVHVRLQRAAAIKVMHVYLASDPTFQARFLREAQSAAALSHPHIVDVFDFGEENNRAYLVMELVPDGSLRTLMRQRAANSGWSLALGVDLVTQAAEGLAYAHRRGMVHRDIKPDNLLLHHPISSAADAASDHYDLKISDFGLARLAESASDLTVTGMVVGTPAYMSPEQCQGEHLDARSDLYSLGVVLYEVATGSLPFRVKTLSEAVFKHVSATPPPPRQLRPDLPEGLEEVILCCLAKRPEDRFVSASELVRALHGALNDSEMATIIAAPGIEMSPRFSTPHAAAETPMQTPAARDSAPPQPISTPAPTPAHSVSLPPTPPVTAEGQPAPASVPLEPAPASPDELTSPSTPVLVTPAHPDKAADQVPSQPHPSADISAVWNVVAARSGVWISGAASAVTSTVTSTVERVRPLVGGAVEQVRPSLAATTVRVVRWAKRRPAWNWGLAAAIAVVVVVVIVALASHSPARASGKGGSHPTAHGAAKPTATVRATVTATPAPTTTPVETVKATYPLTAPTSGWPVTSSCTFTNGGYTIRGGWICYAPGGQLGDATFSVRTQELSGPTSQFYGILLRGAHDGSYYFFGINANQQWTFALMGKGNNPPIVAPTTDTHISAGLNVSNVLTVRARGSQFTFYVNGVQVGTANNTALGQGSFGLTNAAGNVTVVYNDFTITVPQ